ncbi:MAG: lipoate-protein ligase B, partial [Chitinophagaceae bacterium]
MKQEVFFKDLGIRRYKEVWDLQEILLKQNVEAKAEQYKASATYIPQTTNHLLFVEHLPVYTLGKSGKPEHVLIDESFRREKGIGFIVSSQRN